MRMTKLAYISLQHTLRAFHWIPDKGKTHFQSSKPRPRHYLIVQLNSTYLARPYCDLFPLRPTLSGHTFPYLEHQALHLNLNSTAQFRYVSHRKIRFSIFAGLVDQFFHMLPEHSKDTICLDVLKLSI